MKIEQMLSIEPRLQHVVNYAKKRNETAKKYKIYWYEVWHECKIMMNQYVGFNAIKPELRTIDAWDVFHDYLYSLTTNTK